MVQDLEMGQKWHFLCSSWLAIDVGECTLDKVFPAASETDLKRFRWVTLAKLNERYPPEGALYGQKNMDTSILNILFQIYGHLILNCAFFAVIITSNLLERLFTRLSVCIGH